MKTELLVVGKTTDRNCQQGIDDYLGRIAHYMPFSLTVIPALRNSRNLSEQQQRTAEGSQILAHLMPGDHVVLLDERGTERRSLEFAQWLQRKQQDGRRLVFVIGGPYGFSQDVYGRADESMSLSRMTFSHQMVRLVFAEQLYRACTIIKGESYHHE